MLILSRKLGESIMIRDDIKITVISISRERVNLRIDAPPSVKVETKEKNRGGR